MAETKEEKGFVKDREVTLTEVELKVSPHNPEVIDKVIWHTDLGDITWKPKIEKTSYEGGFKIAEKIPMEKIAIPKLLSEMAAGCNEKGKLKIKVAYSFWKTMADGQEVTYRYITSQKTFDEKWSILADKPTGDVLIENIK